MADALWMKVREVDWSAFATSDGSNVATLLRNLASRKLPRAMKANHQVWTAFCGGGEVYPAAVRAVPFLVEILLISDPGVQDGILDVLNRLVAEGGDAKAKVVSQRGAIGTLSNSRDEIVAAKVVDLIELLGK